jgi:hypothetical protein
VQTDLTPPAQVQGLTATSQPESIILSWTANTDPDLVGYRVLRSDLPDGVYTNLSGPTPITGTTFVDTVSPGGFTWQYRVVAVDASGNQSEPAAVSGERPGGPGVVLVTPTDVTAGGATSYGFAATFSNAVQLTPEALAGAITVTGPGGFSQAAAVGATNGRTVSFSITPPGGSWNSADSGGYTISVEANKLGDGAGNFIPAGPIGTFQVNIPPEYAGATPQNPIDLGTVTAVGKRFKGKFIQRDTLVPGTKADLFYSFTVTQPAKLKAALAKMKDNLNFELRDSSGNVLMTSNKPGRKAEKLVRPLAAGTYLLHVTHAGTAQTPFTMKALVGKASKKDLALLGGSS